MSEKRIEMIRQRLNDAFKPTELTIEDQSHQHAGHASAGGAGHFELKIKSAAFAGHPPIQCHKMVYKAVDDIMGSEIHALSIHAGS